MSHSQEVKDRATELYFKIEKHMLTGGHPLSLREINKLLGLSSAASSQMYIKILEQWGLIKRIPFCTRTIVLVPREPPVFYLELTKGDKQHATD